MRDRTIALMFFVAFALWIGLVVGGKAWNKAHAIKPASHMIYLEMRQYNVAGLDETLYVLRYFDVVEHKTIEVRAYSWPAISKVREVMK